MTPFHWHRRDVFCIIQGSVAARATKCCTKKKNMLRKASEIMRPSFFCCCCFFFAFVMILCSVCAQGCWQIEQTYPPNSRFLSQLSCWENTWDIFQSGSVSCRWCHVPEGTAESRIICGEADLPYEAAAAAAAGCSEQIFWGCFKRMGDGRGSAVCDLL